MFHMPIEQKQIQGVKAATLKLWQVNSMIFGGAAT